MARSDASGASSTLFTAVTAKTVADEVSDQIMSLIAAGKLQPGDRLPSEPELARVLGVGRSTIRESKRVLLAKGLLEQHGKTGTFVAANADEGAGVDQLVRLLADGTAQELHDVRRLIEVEAVRRAAAEATAEDLRRLHELLVQMESPPEDDATRPFLLSLEFHRAMVVASHNKVLVAVYDLIARIIRQYQVPYHRVIAELGAELASHQLLLEMLETREADRMAAAMAEHLDKVEEMRLRALDRLTR